MLVCISYDMTQVITVINHFSTVPCRSSCARCAGGMEVDRKVCSLTASKNFRPHSSSVSPPVKRMTECSSRYLSKYYYIMLINGQLIHCISINLNKPFLIVFPCSTFALVLAVLEVCACGSNGVSQRHERHLFHTC